MKRSQIKIVKKRIFNLMILSILLLGLIVLYKIFPTSKSEQLFTANIIYIDSLTQEEVNFSVNSNIDDIGYYFDLPKNINGLNVKKYYLEDDIESQTMIDTEKKESQENKEDSRMFLLPETKYYFSEEEIISTKTKLCVVYDTEETNGKTLYYKILEKELQQNLVKVEGYMPKDSDISIDIVDFAEVETIIKEKDDNLNLNVAYDIKILSSGENYEPNEFDKNIKITISGIINKINDSGIKVIHIDNEENIEEIKSISIEEEDLIFSTESFSIFAIVSPSVIYTEANPVWNGSIATSFSLGSGTQEDPYLISTGEELAYLRVRVNDGQSYSGVYFKLINDIDLNNNAWIPIGTARKNFNGFFDGQGFKISNAIITANGDSAQLYGYGIFGSIGGSSTYSCIVENIVFDNININITFPSYEITTDFTYKIGIVSGAMYRYSKIENVIVRNSNISHTGWTTVASGYRPSVNIGGLVGEAAYSATNSLREVTDGAYIINNCYSDVDINIDLFSNEVESACRFYVGGIIGRISRHNSWPTSCLYTGKMGGESSTVMMGPIFGGEISLDYDTVSDIETMGYIWEGNTNLTMTSYYTDYIVKSTSFTSTWINGDTPSELDYRMDVNPWWYGYLAGVNKGIYTNELSTTMLDMFNTNAQNNNLSTWSYSNGTFDLKSGLELTVTENSNDLYTFTITPESTLEEPNYTYTWYVNGVKDNSLTSNTASFGPSFTTSRKIQVLVSDGTYLSGIQLTLEQLTLGLTITENNGTLIPKFTGTGEPLAKFSEYDINWYEIDIVEGKSETPIATTKDLSELELYREYQLELTNGYEGVENFTVIYEYGKRNIVFVNNVSYTINGNSYVGDNGNLGDTPETAVKTTERAYELISSSGTIENNIIVIMGEYADTDFLDVRGGDQASYDIAEQKFNKDALVTGKYKGTNYGANINFACLDNIYNGKYIFEPTRFEYITFNGDNNRTFLYLQGNDTIMGNGIVMTNYASMDNAEYGHIKGLNTPQFNMFSGFHNYRYARIPEDSRECTVIIKSGTYGRVITGGRNNSKAETVLETSHNIFGGVDDYFTSHFIIDFANPSTSQTPDINLLVAGATDGNIFVNATVDIESGKVARILGGNIGSNSIILEGYPINLFVGSTTININGGDITEIYGASLGRWTDIIYFYGDVKININGGIIRNAIYGAGGAAITGHHKDFGYEYYSRYASGIDTNIEINITGGEIIGDVYGGGYGYSSYLETGVKNDGGALYGDSKINISGGIISGDVYGAGRGYNYTDKPNLAQMIGNSEINISGNPTITGNIYGAGEGIVGSEGIAKLIGTSKINIDLDLSSNIYGGGSNSNVQGTTNVNINSGNQTGVIYGGGLQGNVVGNSNVIINNGTVSQVYGGGDKASVSNSNITVNGGNINTTYGGGNQAGVTTANITVKDGTVSKIFGGSNASGDITKTVITVEDGIVTELYGGNNEGGTTNNSNVYISGGTIPTVYGGGNNAQTTETNVYLQGGETSTIYGGGNNAGANQTNLYFEKGLVENIYGGSNNSGTVAKSNVYIGKNGELDESVVNVTNVYGGNNAGGTTTISNVKCYSGNIVNVFGGGNRVNGTTTNVESLGGIIENIYGGSNQIGNINQTNIIVNDGIITNVYGGNNAGGTTVNSNVIVNEGTITNVYGGNNAGGTTTNAKTQTNGGKITNVFGGGNQAVTNSVILQVNSEILGNVYGGGNQAQVNTNTNVILDGANVLENVYGGGNEGLVSGNTNLRITGAQISGSVYAGGNGTTAIVRGNTNLIIEGNTSIKKHAFGGGNQAATGLENTNNSVSTVNIAGGTIDGNVYGGANTSVVYGITKVNIGNSISNINELNKYNIDIGGTVFGGGEANASGDENYDFSFISVTNGIEINIDADTYEEFIIGKSIFGSGNASTTTGTSIINLRNYGTYKSPKSNVSIQRANTVTLDNCAIWLAGATDRTNEHSNVLFSLSRIDELKLKNNSTLYLQNGANLLKKLSSLVDTQNGEEKAYVKINDNGTIEKNVDNRIYMNEGINLNIAENEQANVYGDVHGMTFLGLYTGKNQLALGIYSKSYENNEQVDVSDKLIFTKSSYVIGEHYETHDITVDGFYSNFKDENDVINVDYITPTPSDQIYYIWNIGELKDAVIYEMELTASKYNTLGTKELQLLGFSTPNTVFEYSGVTLDLVDGINLVDNNEIKNVEENQEIADNNFGLGIETGRNGWNMEGKTKFLSTEPHCKGTTIYLSENSKTTPTLNFYLYHSQNISIERELGTVVIAFTAIQQIDALNKEIINILIYVDMDTALYQDSYYESSLTPGEKYELFTNTQTNITSKSEFSQYYSLLIKDFSESDYYDCHQESYRTLVSSIVLPANTSITMIDMMANSTEYYYYNVTNEDEANNNKEYDISKFKRMGSTEEYFNEDNSRYYNSELDIEHEEFIFHFDFSNCNITSHIENQTIFLEYRDNDDQTLIGVLGDLREDLEYSIYNTGSSISVDADLSKSSVYLGQDLYLNVETNYNQTRVQNKIIYDTNYFGQKSGIKITFFDNDGVQVTGSSLLGVHFELNGNKYYPRTDGTTRINTAENVSNISSNIKVITENSNLASGNYTIKIEAFTSPDGVYYGLESADEVTISLLILNSIYGLKVNLEDNMVIINSETGLTQNDNNKLTFNVEYSSGLISPNIKVGLYRRDYSNIYSSMYNLVNLQDYVANELTTTDISDIYLVTDNPTENFDFALNLKENLVTGTYKVVFYLYDNDVYIGEVYQYIVIN